MTRTRWLIGLMALAAGLRAGFWAYTGRTWEDALITVLHSENFYRGLGLTHFRVDESLPVHGFTSPLSVLIPLAGDWLKLGFGLTLLKLASLVAGGAAVLYVFRIFQAYPELGTDLSTVVLAAGYVAVEHHQILWGMAGMETQIATTVLLASIYYCRAGSPVMLGISLGLCLLARPDFAFWVLIVGLWLAVQRSWRRLIQTAAVTALLYGPWVVFTSWYYGSPIPNTILAKSAGFGLWWRAPMTLWEFFPQLWQKSVGAVFQVLGPCFGGHGTGFRPLPGGRAIAVAMLALLLLARRQKSLGLLYALVAVYTLYYTFLVPVTFGWYTAPLAASAILLCAKGAGDLLRAQPRLAWAGAAVYLGALAWILPTTFTAERNIQQIVEEGIRAKIGRYLNEVAAPNQTIGCEPLGYIGYYSQRTIYDYPGLASRNVVAHIRTDPGKGLITVLRRFRPDFIVLRRQEMETYTRDKDGGFLLSEYHELRRFAVDQRDRQRLLFPDANIDTDFLVLKKSL